MTDSPSSHTQDRRSQLTNDLVLEKINEGVVVADTEGRFVLWNPAATHLVGMGAEDVPPEDWPTHYHLLDPETEEICQFDRLPMLRAIRGENVDNCELIVWNRRSGRKVHINCNARPLHDDNGDLIGGALFFHDVTERRRIEKELRSFAYSVSHDLKAPLTGILGLAQSVQEEHGHLLNADGRESLGDIERCALRMKQLINDLLEHCNLGSHWEVTSGVDLNSILNAVRENLQSEIRASGAEIVTRGRLPVVTGHRASLTMLLQNLVANAIKFVPDGTHPVVTITGTETDLTWELRITDNGIGIEPKYQQRIFDIFRRLHSSNEYPGTGIGLSIVKKVTELHGGSVSVSSEPGKGSTFVISMPKRQNGT